MPADHLITASPSELADAVLAVLAGAEPGAVAANHALDPADLDDAVTTYEAAGLAALEQRAEETWLQVRLEFDDWSTAEHIGATCLAPAIERLRNAGELADWWFLRKYPCWRLRLLEADISTVTAALDQLVASDAITRWWRTVYEPETVAFGGFVAMDAVHELFCADSRGVLDYLRQDEPGLGRRELSMLLLGAFMRAAGLDPFECGDVFDRVARLRPALTETDRACIDRLADQVHTLLATPARPEDGLFHTGGPLAHAASWLDAFRAAGRQLGDAGARGQLQRGLRAILVHIMIFHWNRFGLSAATQGLLAHAATVALLPSS